jgi:mannosyl-glycoprotein endo-beta-N-acetylglucosaminidase
MPLAGSVKPSADVPTDAPYFITLKDLDAWAANPRQKLDGVLEYIPRPQLPIPSDKGKLLVPTNYLFI